MHFQRIRSFHGIIRYRIVYHICPFQCPGILIQIKGCTFADLFICRMQRSCISTKKIPDSQQHVHHLGSSRILITIFQIFKSHVSDKIPHFFCIRGRIHGDSVQLVQHFLISNKGIYNGRPIVYLIRPCLFHKTGHFPVTFRINITVGSSVVCDTENTMDSGFRKYHYGQDQRYDLPDFHTSQRM